MTIASTVLTVLLVSTPAAAQKPPDQAASASASAAELAAIRGDLAALRAEQDAMRKDVAAIRSLLEAALRPRDQGGPSADAPMKIAGRPSKGSANAKVVMVEFTDYQCPYCERYFTSAYAHIGRDYVETGKIRYVVKNLPIEQIHPHAFGAAVAALCAGDQGQYWAMHDRLFRNQKQLGPEQIEAHAAALQLDMARFKTCAAGDSHDALIREDLDEAMRAGVNGTPVFILALASPGADTVTAAKVIVGAQPYEAFSSAIDALLARAH